MIKFALEYLNKWGFSVDVKIPHFALDECALV